MVINSHTEQGNATIKVTKGQKNSAAHKQKETVVDKKSIRIINNSDFNLKIKIIQ